MTGRVRRRPRAPPSPGISSAGVPTSPAGGHARLLLSGISFAGAPTSPVGGPARLLLSEISFAVAPTSPAACGGAVQTGKRKSAFK